MSEWNLTWFSFLFTSFSLREKPLRKSKNNLSKQQPVRPTTKVLTIINIWCFWNLVKQLCSQKNKLKIHSNSVKTNKSVIFVNRLGLLNEFLAQQTSLLYCFTAPSFSDIGSYNNGWEHTYCLPYLFLNGLLKYLGLICKTIIVQYDINVLFFQ